ncbi:MAG TPA: hypothetical protein VHV31_15230 [Nitrolancea sp.]|jgi:hypothetical protein|nr:hypothetical protein [Nitrolancea sp.]
MADQAIIDQLIATIRELNMEIRSRDFGQTVSAADLTGKSDSVPAILFGMRSREMNASQAVKRMLLGEEVVSDDEPATLSEQQVAAGTSAKILLSQFGTAREAILSQVRELPDETWNQTMVTPRGEMTLKDYLQTLVERDNERMAQIKALLGKVSV